jgi:glycosyltransferase involved in cell wall biosynthesis
VLAALSARMAGMPRIKVMALVDTLAVLAGAERLCVDIATRLDPARFESVVCTYADAEPSPGAALPQGPATLQAASIPLFALGRRSRGDVSAWRRFAALVREQRVDVLHSHKFGPNTYAAFFGRLLRIPVVVCHEHTWSYAGDRRRQWLDRELIGRSADAFVAVSQRDADRMVSVERVRSDVIVTIPNGVPLRPPGDGTQFRRELGIDPDAPVVGALGHLRPQKAYGVLVRAAAVLRDRHPGLRVVIVGQHDDPSVPALVSELGLEETVLMPGLRTDVADVLASFDIAVNSSDFEGMPLSVLELMNAGCPIVATRVGGVPEMLEDGRAGTLVEPGDPAALAEAIDGLLGDPPRAAALAARARERCRENFDIDTMVPRFERLYEDLLARKGRPAS